MHLLPDPTELNHTQVHNHLPALDTPRHPRLLQPLSEHRLARRLGHSTTCDTSTHRVAVKVTWLRQHIVEARGGGHRPIGRRDRADASLAACHGEVGRQVDPRPVGRSPQRWRRHFQGKPLASLVTTNSGRGPGTAHFAATRTPNELTPPPPISPMRWRIAAHETVRCVDGKSSTMRCRMATTNGKMALTVATIVQKPQAIRQVIVRLLELLARTLQSPSLP